tara:strand:+ start:498 stop:1085 length:588 start_codon:yes stop_codon:yes gene_type:complete
MKVAFCIPGNNFSGWFLENWTSLIQSIPDQIEWKLFRGYKANIFRIRQDLLEWAREWNPDYYMWIDSDSNFNSTDFYKLIDHDKDIVSGVYLLRDAYKAKKKYGEAPFACHMLNEDRWLTTADIRDKTDLIQVRANGMGWMLVKAKAMNAIKEPFKADGERSEDIIFQERVFDLDFNSYIDPNIIIGHEKMMIIK